MLIFHPANKAVALEVFYTNIDLDILILVVVYTYNIPTSNHDVGGPNLYKTLELFSRDAIYVPNVMKH